jgi:hypothetical protein
VRSHRVPYSPYLGFIRSAASGLAAAHLLLAGFWFSLDKTAIAVASVAMAVAIPSMIAVCT